MSSKRCHESVLQHGKRTSFGRDDRKSRKLTTSDRKWEDMDHEILIYIMKKYLWNQWSPFIDFVVCKTWLSAFLDVMFPPGDVLDLSRILDEHTNFGGRYSWKINKFLNYLKLHLDRRSPNHYTKLVLSKCILHHKVYSDLAQRLPLLKSFVSPGKMSSNDERLRSEPYTNSYHSVSNAMFRHWSNLEDVHCHYSMLCDLSCFCKSVQNLTLVGKPGNRDWIRDNIASVIAKGFPLLDRLGISACVFSFTGLSMILDSHKNLSYLDMTHTILIPDQVMQKSWFPLAPQDYPWPKELSQKVAAVRTSLTCDRKNCPNCIDFDTRYSYMPSNLKVLP